MLIQVASVCVIDKDLFNLIQRLFFVVGESEKQCVNLLLFCIHKKT